MEATRSSETSLYNKTTWRQIPFFIVTAVKTSNPTKLNFVKIVHYKKPCRSEDPADNKEAFNPNQRGLSGWDV
jgi:hypothetical protein